MPRIQISDEGVALIKRWEGLKTQAYDDNGATAGGTWTIGYGHTGPDVKPGMVITEAQAEQLLRDDLRWAQDIVERAVKVPLSPGQYAALTSFVFNVGPGRAARGSDPGKDGFVTLKNGNPSTMLRKLNAGDYEGAVAEFPKWTRGPAGTHEGLVNRRAAEVGLFVRGAHVATNTVEPVAPPKPTVVNTVEGVAGSIAGAAVILQGAAEQVKPYISIWGGLQWVFIALAIGGIALTAGSALIRLRRQKSL